MKKETIILMLLLVVSELRNIQLTHKYEVLLSKQESVIVTGTMYNAVQGQCDSDPLLTAGMYRIDPNNASKQRYVALSRDLIKRWGGMFDYGDIIKIEGAGFKNGFYKVVDTMNKRFKNRMDFLETKGTKHYKFNNIKITKVTSVSLT